MTRKNRGELVVILTAVASLAIAISFDSSRFASNDVSLV